MAITNVTYGDYVKADGLYQRGKKFRVIKNGVILSGTIPTAEWAQKGIGRQIPIGTILTCNGFCQQMGSDSGINVGWSDEYGHKIMNYCSVEPAIWSQYLAAWPEEGYLELV